MRQFQNFILVLVLSLVIGGCSDEPKPPVAGEVPAPVDQPDQSRFDIAVLARGALLYQQNCAECHGPEAQGHPDWEKAKERGYSAAPPLDGSGPARHRSRSELVTVIRKGAMYNGKPVMPAWQGRVADQDINAVIAWFQALWPGEVYANWQRKNPSPTGK